MEIVSILSGIFFVGATAPYAVSAYTGRITVSRVSWIIWFLNDVLMWATMSAQGSLNWLMISATLCAFAMVIVTFRRGVGGASLTDKICLTGTVIGGIAWIVLGGALIPYIVSVCIGFLGGIPTFVNAWNNPFKESFMVWVLYTVSTVLGVIAIPVFDIPHSAQPIAFLLISIITLGAIVLGRKRVVAMQGETVDNNAKTR